MALSTSPALAAPDFIDHLAPEAPHFAREELERQLYFHPDDATAHARLAALCLRLGDYPAAEAHFQHAEAAAPPASRWPWRLRRAEALALSGRPGPALELLWPLTRQPAAAVPAWKRVLWVALRAHWWGQALEAARALLPLTPEATARLGPLIRELQAHLASPALSADQARLFSSVLPGSGQLYAGAWRDGLTSFGINAGLAGLLVAACRSQDWLGAALVVGLGGRYYLGGIAHAGERAEERNTQAEQALADRWLDRQGAWLLEGPSVY